MKLKKYAWLLFAAVFIIVIIFAIKPGKQSGAEANPIEEPIEEVEPKFYLTLPADTLVFEDHTITSGESFGSILGERGVSTSTIYSIASRIDSVFDVTKIRSGVTVKVAKGENSSVPSYFIYPENAFEYIIVSLNSDSIYAHKYVKERTVKRKVISGTIEDALYLSVNNAGGTNALAMSLVNIYAWSIDFFRIQKGDAFSVIYEEEYVDDTTSVGLKRVLGPNLIHSGNDYYSFQYENELGFDDYFDEEGRSLRKTFLRAPLNFTRISSRYSGRRFHPVQKRWKAHLGTDYAAPTGTPIMTTADGEISAASYTSGNGNYVKVRHNSTYSTQYLHMSKIKPGIKPGVRVKQGDVIGYVGSTGLATGPHVCYRFWVNGKQVDPYKQKLPEAKSLDSTRLAAFKEYSEKLIQELGNN